MASDLFRHMLPSKSATSVKPAAADDSELTDLQLQWREALVCWLRWNEAYENVTAAMFQQGQSPQQLERLMDQMDALRRHAVELSQELLD